MTVIERLDARRSTAAGLVLLLAAGCWALAARRMSGMNMWPGADLGSLSFFAATWPAMMAAMMLPSALPAVLSLDGVVGRRRSGAAASPVAFAAVYVAVWTLTGLALFFAYRGVRGAQLGFLAWGREGPYVAGAAIVAAGLYELSPLKRACLRHCRALGAHGGRGAARAGLSYGVACLGASAGLMVALLALGLMSLTWMLVVAAVLLLEKVAATGPRFVTPVGLLLIVVGVWVALAPSSVPGLTTPMPMPMAPAPAHMTMKM